ncbi:MAG TPA: ATP-binding cassette domain-containing protein [Ktedonobacteraceae bacterium]
MSEENAGRELHAPPSSSSSFLSIEAVSVRFAGVQALSDVSFQVPQGDVLAVIGPRGAGKTSLLNVISRVSPPVAGRVTFAGRDLLKLKTHQVARAGIARTFQNPGQFSTMTVLDYLLLGRHTRMHSGILRGGLYVFGTHAEEKRNRAFCLHLLDVVGLKDLCNSRLGSLPYGLQKRTDLARALALEPKLLLLDEPLEGLGLEEKEEIATVLLTIKEQLGMTQILAEQDMARVLGIADHVLLLDAGRVIAQGIPAEM